MRVIALEEHFTTESIARESARHRDRSSSRMVDELASKLLDLGHMGEYLPYSMARTTRVLTRAGLKLGRPIAAYFRENFHYPTSGFLADSSLLCAIAVLGIDRPMFSVDYPFSDNAESVAFLKNAPISDADREKLAHGNAERLPRL